MRDSLYTEGRSLKMRDLADGAVDRISKQQTGGQGAGDVKTPVVYGAQRGARSLA